MMCFRNKKLSLLLEVWKKNMLFALYRLNKLTSSRKYRPNSVSATRISSSSKNKQRWWALHAKLHGILWWTCWI